MSRGAPGLHERFLIATAHAAAATARPIGGIPFDGGESRCIMRIVFLNPPHTAIGSRIPDDHLPPLGLLAIGGPLIDAGHDVTLVDADLEALSDDVIVRRVAELAPDVLMVGHSGSTSAHPTVARLTRALRVRLPRATFVYGGPFPTYHHRDVLSAEPQLDVIVRGEGEATVVALVTALTTGASLHTVRGIAFRDRSARTRGGDDEIVATEPAATIADLDAYRVGWELIDHARYSYWGRQRAVVIQFSRGCPHPCNYCGQRGFWTTWRHRDPRKLAKEIARLHREHGVQVVDLRDEACIRLLADFIAQKPEVWNEDIGEE